MLANLSILANTSSLNKLRVLIVDDEPIARKVLREELACLEEVELLGEASNGDAALLDISSLKPDLVFLDIQMPSLSGFEMIKRLDEGHLPIVIIVTAFDQYAIRAFEAGAIDYLLKPVSQERLRQAVDRAANLHGHPRKIAEHIADLQHVVPLAAPAPKLDRPRNPKIVGREGHEYFLLHPDEVLAFQANGDSVVILTVKRRYLATQTLRSLEERLDRSSFRRIHRNALVNINQIRKISMITSQRWLLTMNNDQEFVVSKRQAREIRDVLHW